MGDLNRVTELGQPRCRVPGCGAQADFWHPSSQSRSGGLPSDDGSYLCSRHYVARLNSDGEHDPRTVPTHLIRPPLREDTVS